MPRKRHLPGAGRRLRNFVPTLVCLVIIGIILAACRGSAAASPPTRTPALPTASSDASARQAVPTASATITPILPETPTISPTPAKAKATSAPARTKTVTRLTATAAVEQVSVPAGAVVAPILLYHHVSDKASPNRYVIGLEAFRAQMQTLQKAGYETVTISQLAGVIRSGGRLPLKPVALTFDDGYLDTYENAFPILQEFGYTATVYIITGTLGTKLSYGYMQEKELSALVAAGWEIGSHSVTHTSLLTSKLGMGNELKESKENLEKKLGITIHSFSYPFGVANKSIEALPAQYGYDSAVGLDTIITHPPSRLFYLGRREVYRGITLKQFGALLAPGINDSILATQAAITQTPKAP